MAFSIDNMEYQIYGKECTETNHHWIKSDDNN